MLKFSFVRSFKVELQNYGHNKTTTTPEMTKQEDFRHPPAHAYVTHVHSQTRQGNVITRTTIVILQQVPVISSDD